MRRYLLSIVAAVGLVLSLTAHAQAPTVTATCKDGTPFSGTTRSGACRGHGGVKSWDTAAPSTTAPATGAATAPATGAATPPAQTTRWSTRRRASVGEHIFEGLSLPWRPLVREDESRRVYV